MAAFPKGMSYKGAVDYYKDLPNNPEIGDVYTVKYTGTSGTEALGVEYGWGTYESTNQWIDLGPDLSRYQPLPSMLFPFIVFIFVPLTRSG